MKADVEQVHQDAFVTAFILSCDLGDVLPDLPVHVGRALLDGLIEAVDGVRADRGEPPFRRALYVPEVPDFLKSRSDWRKDLVSAWRALAPDDRAAFLARVTVQKAA